MVCSLSLLRFYPHGERIRRLIGMIDAMEFEVCLPSESFALVVAISLCNNNDSPVVKTKLDLRTETDPRCRNTGTRCRVVSVPHLSRAA